MMSPHRQIVLCASGMVVLLLAVYGGSLWSAFVFWDDTLLVVGNPAAHGFSWSTIVAAFTTYDPDLYVPLTILSYQANYAAAGLQPFVYHLTNLLLHAGSTLLVGWIIVQITGKKSVAVLTALLFAVHPVNTEAVVWVSARKDLLSGFFFLLSLGSFLRFRSGGDWRWYAVSLLAFLFGLLSKVSILGLPFILLLTDWYARRSSRRREVLIAPFVLLSVLFGAAALLGKDGGSFTFFEKFLVGMKATVFSLWHLAWPFSYSVVYPFTDAVTLTRPDLWVPLLLVVGSGLSALFLRKCLPSFLFCWAWFLLLIAPSFLTAEKGKDVVSTLYLTSDRYVYLAAIGVFFGLALAFERLRERSRRSYRLVTAALILSLSVLAWRQSLVWKDTESLLRHALALYPQSSIAHNNLGVYYDSQGRREDALREYRSAVENGATSDAWYNLGVAAVREKRSTEAIDAFTKAIRLRPGHVLALLNLGALLTDAGRVEEAVQHLLAAQKLDPGNITVYLNLGIALEKGGDPLDARRAYERVLLLDPENVFARERMKALGPAT